MKDILESAKAAFGMSWKIVDAANQDELRCILLEDLALFYYITNNVEMRRKVLRDCIELAQKIGHKGFVSSASEKYEHYEKAPPFITGPKDVGKSTEEDFEELSEEEIIKMHKYLLQIAGIDLNGEDELAKLARVGLRDRNPERILKHCEHLYVEVVSYGPIWEMVGLTSTGQKILFCEKNGCIIGWQLDEILKRFKEINCASCNSHSPRPQNWKWTHRWHRERGMPEKMKEIIQRYKQT
jgi:hypothetical protein